MRRQMSKPLPLPTEPSREDVAAALARDHGGKIAPVLMQLSRWLWHFGGEAEQELRRRCNAQQRVRGWVIHHEGDPRTWDLTGGPS